MRIEVFAILKDHFKQEFEIESSAKNIEELKTQLLQMQPNASGVLNISRFAVNDEFIDNNYQFSENDTISILPPASGG